MEPPEIIEPITVSPEITHEEFVKPIEVPTTSQTSEIDVAPSQPIDLATASPEAHESPEQNEDSPEQESGHPEEQQTPTATSQKKRRRKGKVTEVQEDNLIDVDFASRLDMSCIEGTAAPAINDAFVVEYIQYDQTFFTDFHRMRIFILVNSFQSEERGIHFPGVCLCL